MLTIGTMLHSRSIELTYLAWLKFYTHWISTPQFPSPGNTTLLLASRNLIILDAFETGIMQYLTFGDWLISFRIMSLRSIYVVIGPMLFTSLCNSEKTLIATGETTGYIYITPASSPSWVHGQQEVPPMLRKPFSNLESNSFLLSVRSYSEIVLGTETPRI